MLLLLIAKGYPLDEVVFYDTGKEFQAIYDTREKVLPVLKEKGIKYVELSPKESFDTMMFDRKVKSGKVGYGWCGGVCRWGTTYKLAAIENYCKNAYEYVGIVADEQERLIKERKGNKKFPLAEWKLSERDCRKYCYHRGFKWEENGIQLYSILKRVSCWCCRNKNLRELKNMYFRLPVYWEKLKSIQGRLPEPMKQCGSIFDLERRFDFEAQRKNRGLSISNREFYKELKEILNN